MSLWLVGVAGGEALNWGKLLADGGGHYVEGVSSDVFLPQGDIEVYLSSMTCQSWVQTQKLRFGRRWRSCAVTFMEVQPGDSGVGGRARQRMAGSL